MEAGTRVDILLFVDQHCSLIFFFDNYFLAGEEKASDKWSVSGSRKWKFGGKIMWTLEIRGLKWWKV